MLYDLKQFENREMYDILCKENDSFQRREKRLNEFLKGGITKVDYTLGYSER